MYIDRNDPSAGPKYVEREHPIVRVHPATGWKSLWVNRGMTVRIVGLEKAESDVILNYLYDVYERNVDIQVRFKWTPGASGMSSLPVCSFISPRFFYNYFTTCQTNPSQKLSGTIV